jgi:hypothetical protein
VPDEGIRNAVWACPSHVYLPHRASKNLGRRDNRSDAAFHMSLLAFLVGRIGSWLIRAVVSPWIWVTSVAAAAQAQF